MKRENFIVTNVTTGESVIKFAWNAANRTIESMIRDIAQRERKTFVRSEISGEKEGFNFVRGRRVWTSEDGTKSFVFTIEKSA